MSATLQPSSVARAAVVAASAADCAGVAVRPADGVAEHGAVSALLDEIWSVQDGALLPSSLLLAATHAGNYLATAWAGEQLVGAAFAFLGRDDERVHLHSHVVGVHPGHRGRGVGFALKVHQRAWALARGLRIVSWTYDPLVRRNGYVNLTKLGARIVAYHPEFYGSLTDGVNNGDDSDRVVVEWTLDEGRVAAASAGRHRRLKADRLRAEGAVVALDVDGDGKPVEGSRSGRVLLCRTPDDVVTLRHRNRALASDWRRALRSTIGGALEAGFTATAVTDDGWYVLERGTS